MINKFNNGDTVLFTSKSDSSVSGTYVVASYEHTSEFHMPSATVSNDKPYVGWCYSLVGIDMLVAESSLSEADA